MEAVTVMSHLTWSYAASDPYGAPLPQGLILPGRPLTFQKAGCGDCGWSAVARTYAEIIDAREIHEYGSTCIQLPLITEEVAA